MIWACSKTYTVVRTIIMLVTAVLPLVSLYLMKLLLDAFAMAERPTFDQILWILIGFALVKIVSIILSNIQSYVSLLQADVLADYMSDILIRKSISTDLEYFDSDDYHDIFQRALSQGGRPLQVLNSINNLGVSIFTLLAIAGFLIGLHWVIALALLFIALPVGYIKWYYSEKNVELKEKQTQRERKAGYFKRVLNEC